MYIFEKVIRLCWLVSPIRLLFVTRERLGRTFISTAAAPSFSLCETIKAVFISVSAEYSALRSQRSFLH